MAFPNQDLLTFVNFFIAHYQCFSAKIIEGSGWLSFELIRRGEQVSLYWLSGANKTHLWGPPRIAGIHFVAQTEYQTNW